MGPPKMRFDSPPKKDAAPAQKGSPSPAKEAKADDSKAGEEPAKKEKGSSRGSDSSPSPPKLRPKEKDDPLKKVISEVVAGEEDASDDDKSTKAEKKVETKDNKSGK